MCHGARVVHEVTNADLLRALNRLAWLEQVAFDARLTSFDVRLATALATRWLNADTGDAWPAQATIAQTLGVTVEGIRKSIRRLQAGGLLDVSEGGGRTRSCRYRPLIRQIADEQNPQRGLGNCEREPQTANGELEGQTPGASAWPDGMLATRSQASEFLKARGVSIEPATLASWSSRRPDGPPFKRLGRTVVYNIGDLRAWLIRALERS